MYKGVENSTSSTPRSTSSIFVAKVISIEDSKDAGRIKVFIQGVDRDNKPTGDIGDVTDNGAPVEGAEVFAFPLMPKMFSVMPKVGESVFILTQNINNQNHRLWMGPIISQLPRLLKDPHDDTSQSGLGHGSSQSGLEPGLKSYKNSEGIYPDKKYVSMQGRYNTDIIHKSNELVFRAGKFVEGNPYHYNDKSMGYIQIKGHMALNSSTKSEDPYDFVGKYLKKDTGMDDTKFGSVVNLFGNRINLISHDGTPTFNTLTTDDDAQEDVVREIIKKAHPLVFGDTLLEFLEVFKDFALHHVHQINLPPLSGLEIYKKLDKWPLEKILSKNIRIN